MESREGELYTARERCAVHSKARQPYYSTSRRNASYPINRAFSTLQGGREWVVTLCSPKSGQAVFDHTGITAGTDGALVFFQWTEQFADAQPPSRPFLSKKKKRELLKRGLSTAKTIVAPFPNKKTKGGCSREVRRRPTIAPSFPLKTRLSRARA